ncbi:MAG: PHP domain-containing protein [Parasporobacterium sp.]|nr:PHP domain-containing protein [Parasporobacterium sp.]
MRQDHHITDLHMHTLHSDGTYSTSEVLKMLENKNVDLFSFTDHDSVGCYYDLAEGRAFLYPGVTLIPGVELSCRVDGMMRDMLGYGISVPYIDAYLKDRYSRENRIKKQTQVLDRFKEICRMKGLVFDETIKVEEGKKAEGYTVMYMELNRHPENIVKYPFVEDCTRLFWDFFSNRSSDFFVDETFDLPEFDEAVDVIHKAGGLAFIAHPFVYGLSDEETETLVRLAVDAGVDGLELKHQSNKDGHVEKLLKMAEKYHLYTSGGTDFHGLNKPGIELVTGYGNMLVDYSEVEPWINTVKHFEGADIIL